MRKLAIAVALASTAMATPAVARDHSFYAGLEGGVMSSRTWTSTSKRLRTSLNGAHHHASIAVSILMLLRVTTSVWFASKAKSVQAGVVNQLELELPPIGCGYRSPTSTPMARPCPFSYGQLPARLRRRRRPGAVTSAAVSVSPGQARSVRTRRPTALSASRIATAAFAWQAIAGVRYAVSPNIDLGLKYRFFNVSDASLRRFDGIGVDLDGSTAVRTVCWRA